MRKNGTFLILFFLFAACNTIKYSYVSNPNEEWEKNSLPTDIPINHTFYFIGELGISNLNENPLRPILKKQFQASDSNTSIVFLGSHVYPKGLSKEDKKRRPQGEEKLLDKIELLEGFKGNYFFSSGEHDWEYRGDKGLKAIERMEDFLEDTLLAKDFFLPENGCAGPEKVRINKEIDMLFVNSQWWFEDWENEKDINEDCDIKSRTEFIDELREDLLQNKNDQLIVVMHHPLYSNGVHGGKIPAKYHFFPLTEIKPKAYIPMPILGSLAALYRNISGTKQDLAHVQQQTFKKEVLSAFAEIDDIICVSSHDQSLQHFENEIENQHFIVSGSGGKVGYARGGGEADFVSAKQGYSKVIVYENEEVWMEFYGLEEGKLKLLFRKLLIEGKAEVEEILTQEELMTEFPDSITLTAGEIYELKKVGRFFFGDTYRDVWNTPITVPVLNIAEEPHNSVPVKKGGGQQSNSLRLKDTLEREYVLRSIMKFADKETPEMLRGTWAQRIVQDLMSAAHPYGAITIPTMSKAANIYHTEPKLVYVPKQPALGIYNQTFGNELYLYEDRPDDDRSDLDGFGNSKKIMGINDLRPALEKDHDNVVDQEWVLRSRIFDMLIHDWDRHDDQWRWASFEEGDKTIFRPIPRDRDQVYFRFDGFFPWMVSTFILEKFRTFKYDLKAPRHFSINAQTFDRYFLNRMEEEDWEREAQFLKENITDSVIVEAIKSWPKEVYDLDGEFVIDRLQSRRDKLPTIANKMYKWLAKRVNVIGTNDEERFEVTRFKNGDTEVKVYDLNKDGEKSDLFYERTFKRKETQEIRLYGLEDDDEFIITGKTRRGSKVRIIGGSGDDIVNDESRVVGLRKLTKVYDKKNEISITDNNEVRNLTSNRYDVNDYNREVNNYNNFAPLFSFGSNFDDGFFLGGGLTATLQGFRSFPYKAVHTISASIAPSTNAFSFQYNLDRRNTFYKLGMDYIFNTTLLSPFYINYYGIGNETEYNQDIFREFYFVRLIDYRVRTGMKKTWINDRYSLRFGPAFQSTKVDVIEGRISEAPNLGLTTEQKQRKNFLGAFLEASVNTVKTTDARPTEGIAINVNAEYLNTIKSKSNFANFTGDITYYVSFFEKMQTTIAIRTGAGATVGDAPFYSLQTLGGFNNFNAGSSNIRGYRRDRFTGSYLFYQNIDLRIKLFKWQNRIFPFGMGLIGGFDYGRIWEPGDTSKKLHKGYTAGAWLSPFNFINLTFNYSISEEDKLFSFGFGYFF